MSFSLLQARLKVDTSSSVSFDIKDTQQVPGALNIVNGATGSYTWTVSAPSDLTNAGLSVANVNVAYDASKGDGALNVNGNEAYYQTAGGDYVIGTENVPGYPTGSSAASMFTPTESAASIMASASSVAATYFALVVESIIHYCFILL